MGTYSVIHNYDKIASSEVISTTIKSPIDITNREVKTYNEWQAFDNKYNFRKTLDKESLKRIRELLTKVADLEGQYGTFRTMVMTEYKLSKIPHIKGNKLEHYISTRPNSKESKHEESVFKYNLAILGEYFDRWRYGIETLSKFLDEGYNDNEVISDNEGASIGIRNSLWLIYGELIGYIDKTELPK